MMDDLISRQAAIDAIKAIAKGESDVKAVTDMNVGVLQRLPSAQPTQSNTLNALDTIYRQAAIKELLSLNDQCNSVYYTKCIDDAVYALEILPSAQPEIIRCKDCKWWSNDNYRECSSPNYDDGYVTPAGFYCGWAERRTDGFDRQTGGT